ncbi:Transcriptional regulator, GntR family [Desulfonema limicola]|uniref:Transcriptional regulator, GntR family n=1 Tax=Desulfonema limicola TaxID=45656 RepID=A0A975B3B9_9BACT|nr:FadR/GntR family transcriptional regulator [Desulfonema limicola]QTA78025.1 Transcriptional regulator, GntR family [Desulfonema limicola]
MPKNPKMDKQTTFRAARQSRIFQDVVDQIQEAILTGEFKPGDMLPSERDMKEMFKTSRGTLREALRVLEQKGLIEIRLGVNGGAMVKASMTESLNESLGLMLRYRKISLNHLHEFRGDIEGIVTAKAAEKANKKDIENLKDILKQAKKHVENGIGQWQEFLNMDKKFHQAIANISANSIYIFIHNMIHDNIQPYYDKFLPPDDKRLKENYQDLCDILESIENKNIEKARDHAQKHIHRFNKYMTDQSLVVM